MILNRQELNRRSVLRLKGIEAGQALIGPATVEFHLTDLCNLSCKFCWYYGLGVPNPPTGKEHLSYEVFEHVARDCADLQVDSIFLSGMGEPTLHPRFYDMLEHLEPSFGVTIFSNGTFPLERCRDILRADHIVINLGEADRKGYRALHGRDLFMKVIRNIRQLAKLRPKYNPKFCIEVVFIATQLNIDSLAKTEELVRRLGVDRIRKKTAESNGFNQEIILSHGHNSDEGTAQWPPCFQGWYYTAIKLNGDVNLCSFMRRSLMGNVYTTSLKEIWASEAYKQARTSLVDGHPFRNYNECMHCPIASRNKEIASHMETYNKVLKA